MARREKSPATKPPVATPSRLRRIAPFLTAGTVALALSANLFWHRAPSHAIAQEAPGTRLDPSLTLDAAQFTGEAREAYEIARRQPDLFPKLHCYCGCDKLLGHRNLQDCYRDRHAASCATCMGEAKDANQMSSQGSPVEQILDALRARYAYAE
jgi:Protein of unknown function with PCYCGC motif